MTNLDEILSVLSESVEESYAVRLVFRRSGIHDGDDSNQQFALLMEYDGVSEHIVFQAMIEGMDSPAYEHDWGPDAFEGITYNRAGAELFFPFTMCENLEAATEYLRIVVGSEGFGWDGSIYEPVWSAEEERWRLYVSDNGPRIPSIQPTITTTIGKRERIQ